MPTYLTPGVYVEEVSMGTRPIAAVGTSTAALVGVAPDANARLNEPVACNSWSQFLKEFAPEGSVGTHLARAVFGYFMNGGARCYVVNVGQKNPIGGDARARTGLWALDAIDEVAIVAAPGYTDAASYDALLTTASDSATGLRYWTHRSRSATLTCSRRWPLSREPQVVTTLKARSRHAAAVKGAGCGLEIQMEGMARFTSPGSWVETP